MARITERITDPKVMIAHMSRKIMSMRDAKERRDKLIALKVFCEITGYGYVFERGLRAVLPSLELEDAKKPLDFVPAPVSGEDSTGVEDFLASLDKELKK
jgi:hypothetical protein